MSPIRPTAAAGELKWYYALLRGCERRRESTSGKGARRLATVSSTGRRTNLEIEMQAADRSANANLPLGDTDWGAARLIETPG
jgi:hypothetical protein